MLEVIKYLGIGAVIVVVSHMIIKDAVVAAMRKHEADKTIK